MNKSNILFHSKDNQLILEHLYTVDDYTTFNIKIKSGQFAGASSFCMPRENIISTIDILAKMNKSLQGSCIINDIDSDALIVFEMGNLGHMLIYGQIGGSHQDHFMKFSFLADQTVLPGLILLFKEFVLHRDFDSTGMLSEQLP